MPTLVKNLEIIGDPWIRLTDDEAAASDHLILPLESWRQARDMGVWLDNDADVESIGEEIASAPVIAIHFPQFPDGRALSIGAMLRKHYDFAGELRAFGDILPDLAVFMHRCGFDAIEFASREDAETAIACIGQTTDFYQSSVRNPTPPFRRAAW